MTTFEELVRDVMVRGGEMLVRTLAAVIIAFMIVGIGAAVRPLVRRRVARHGRPSRTRVFVALYRVVVALVAFLLAVTLAFPSVSVANVLASLGIISVAVGFAFKDVLENLLAGVLLLLRDPFRSGDQIRIAGYEGTVEGITVRETLVRTFEGERVLIPNAQVYTGVLEVVTHYPVVRVGFRLLLDPDSDPAAVRSAILPAVEPLSDARGAGPQVVVHGVTDGALEVGVRLWAGSASADRVRVVDMAVGAVLAALGAAGIALDQPHTLLVDGTDRTMGGTGTG